MGEAKSIEARGGDDWWVGIDHGQLAIPPGGEAVDSLSAPTSTEVV